ncbi:MAG TPA: hypothetical protein DCY88_23740 [Cyanobacteria bacterium UBA11372]|nr:hypothetical protein [Cyanobacteria bacterium UBA11372]HBE34686.1 hypothetical protein [Cyanobacteria bacterium UBA11368]
MRRIRFVALGIVSFVVSIFGALLAPGTFLNRALSTALCTVFSFNSAVCTASLVQSSERVVAATPPAVERSIADISGYLQAQRDPSEFGDEPSAPTPGSNPQAPPFPQDPGPNFPVRREFDNPGSGQPTQPQPNLSGIWLYSVYRSPSDNVPLQSYPIKITQSSNGYKISICNNNCGIVRQPQSNFLHTPSTGQPIIETYGNVTVTSTFSADGQTVWGNISRTKSGEVIFFSMERQSPSGSTSFVKQLTSNINGKNSSIVEIAQVVPPVDPSQAPGDPPRKPPEQRPSRPQGPPRPEEGEKPESRGGLERGLGERLDVNAMTKARDWIVEHPWETIGAIAAAGLATVVIVSCVTNLPVCAAIAPNLLRFIVSALAFLARQPEPAWAETPQQSTPPVVTSFTCKGQTSCTVNAGEENYLLFTYEDSDGNASSWSAGIDSDQISPPNGGGTITPGIVCECTGSRCTRPDIDTYQVIVTDTTGLQSKPLSVTVTCSP